MNHTFGQVLTMAMAVVGGLGIFMLGMKYMSEGMQAVAGNSLRRMISMVTENRLLATGTGTTVTLLVQSSTISTVIMVGLVNAGLMKLHQAVGFIMGANIGTTITGWVLILQIGRYGLPILGVAALVYIFCKRDRLRFIAMAIMGLGMIFFGLELMKEGVEPLREMEQVRELIQRLAVDNYAGILLCIALGCLLTFIVQSSSAALAILIAAAATGLVPFPIAAAFILGENIGTTITVLIATLGANRNAKRAAYAHVLFNVIGVSWMLLAFPFFVLGVAGAVEWVHGVDPMTMDIADFENPAQYGLVITAAIAVMHTSFNITNTLLFLPFVRSFARLLERVVPEPRAKEVAHLKHLDAKTVDAPGLALEQSRGEVVQMGRGTVKMMDWIRQLAFNGPMDEQMVQKTMHREEVLDNIETEIVAFVTDVLDANLPHSVAEEGRVQLRMAHEYESISDALASVLKCFLKLRELKLELSAAHLRELRDLHDEVATFLGKVTDAYDHRKVFSHREAETISSDITRQVKDSRERYLQLMTDSQIDARLSMTYTTLLTNYRRIKEHTLNAHEAMAGTKAHHRD
ncbi:Na/Pi cotransporter family protein [Phycisphaerales bacterium AB-hyl4]|uniref:Na/Pi cotransporter family protein n=1 Tax=Natronomicrosphaera hydrolytica TaxID=3242702 RepID=A0ABV4U3V0_9BACT